MALIACPECGKQISDKAPTCPHCGAPALSAPVAAQEREQYAAIFPDQDKRPTSPWPAVISVAVLTVIAVSCVNMGKGSETNTPRAFDSTDALYLCQQALKRASRDPEKAEAPPVENFGKGDEFYFAWGASTKMARMRNGFGLEVAASASCTVSQTQKRITSLTLDGKTIL